LRSVISGCIFGAQENGGVIILGQEICQTIQAGPYAFLSVAFRQSIKKSWFQLSSTVLKTHKARVENNKYVVASVEQAAGETVIQWYIIIRESFTTLF
jgi:hypothetical protein